jgi:hypothetical protein
MTQPEQSTKGARQRTGISQINELLAKRITVLVGTMWAFYAFLLFGLTPLVWPAYEEQVLYWSNFLQLMFLPIITVGTAILSQGTNERAEADHEIVAKEFALLQDTHTELGESLNRIESRLEALLARSGQV